MNERMEKVLCSDLGIMTPEEELEYLKELILRYPDIAADYLEGRE